MKRIIATILLLTATAAAIAACPPYAPYNCRPTWGGKQICGCGQ